MYARQTTSKQFPQNTLARLGAFGSVIFMSIVATVIVMASVQGEAAIPAEASLYAVWTIIAGAVGGGLALVAARGWLGLPGAIGYARALVGCVAAALIGSVVAGALILPIAGAFYAPVMLISAFVAKPTLAILWVAAYYSVHYIMLPQQDAREEIFVASAPRYASSELSSLTQAQLYRRK